MAPWYPFSADNLSFCIKGKNFLNTLCSIKANASPRPFDYPIETTKYSRTDTGNLRTKGISCCPMIHRGCHPGLLTHHNSSRFQIYTYSPLWKPSSFPFFNVPVHQTPLTLTLCQLLIRWNKCILGNNEIPTSAIPYITMEVLLLTFMTNRITWNLHFYWRFAPMCRWSKVQLQEGHSSTLTCRGSVDGRPMGM